MCTNLVWAKRPVYIVQMTPKDPYYNYGCQELWMDAEVPIVAVWKVINDRAGKYWKTEWQSWAAYQGPGDDQRAFVCSVLMGIDDRTDHASVFRICTPEHHVIYKGVFARDDFSMAGFQRFCK